MPPLEITSFSTMALLHVDPDGNDYWIIESPNLANFRPDIPILEYNVLFGSARAISVPNNPFYNRIESHYSGKYFGVSLRAMSDVARKKG
ncbi:hypothetical protein MCEMSEM52_00262 [Burkholderiales bacterium]|jgi:hypothetical protein